MAVLFPGKMLWLATPRTASTAIRDALLKAGGEPMGGHHCGLEHSGGGRRLIVGGSGEQFGEHEGEPVVTTIRNPYDLLVTWWLRHRHKAHEWRSFPDYIATYNRKPSFARSGDRLLYHAPNADILVRYENLDVELPAALKKCGLEPITLTERKNDTPGKTDDWRSYYDAESIEAANRRFGAEIEQYGYELLG